MSVLDDIIARKISDVAQRRGDAPKFHPERSDRSLHAALAQPGARFLLEFKRCSPSAGTLRAQADPVDIARAYSSVADAISVLCDEPYFGGSLDDLREVRAHTHLPVLCKDFIVDPWQIQEARAAGADAVLLMLSVLNDDTYRACVKVAEELAVDVLTEAHTAEEVHRAVQLGAPLIGINNRDLHSLHVNLDTTRQLASLVPSDRLVVSESGITTRADVRTLAEHADAFLVGSSMMSHDDVEDAAKALIFGRVKVCGLTTGEAATAAERAGARWGGVVFTDSPRQVDVTVAEQLAHSTRLPLVGVFVDADADTVAKTATKVGLAAVQLHGSESIDTIREVRLLLPHTELWRVVHDPAEVTRLPEVDRWIVDAAPTGGLRGGSGQTWDWSTLVEAEHVIVAGGLTPDNAYEASQLGAYGLDVSSGVESVQGIKDPGKIADFFLSLRGPCRGEA